MNSLEHKAEKPLKTMSITYTCQMSLQFPEICEWEEFDFQKWGLILSRNRVQLQFWSISGKVHKAINTFLDSACALFHNFAMPHTPCHDACVVGIWQRAGERISCFPEWASANVEFTGFTCPPIQYTCLVRLEQRLE